MKAVPVNDAEWNESQWSAIRTVDLSLSGVEGAETDTHDCDVEYFNMQGMRVDKSRLAPGIYIRRQGSATEKVYIN